MKNLVEVLKSNTDKIIQTAKIATNEAILKMVQQYAEKTNVIFGQKNVPRNKVFYYTKGNIYANRGKGYDFKLYFDILDSELIVKVQNLFTCTTSCVLDNTSRNIEDVAKLTAKYSLQGLEYYNIPTEKGFTAKCFEHNNILTNFYIEDFEENVQELLLAVENVLLGRDKEEETEESMLQAKLANLGVNLDIVIIAEKVATFKEQGLPQIYWLDVLAK